MLSSLAAPGLFSVLTLYQGSSIIFVRSLPPYETFNVRYGLYIFPLILGLAALLVRFPRGNLLLSALVVAQLVLLAMGPSATAFDEPQVSVTACAAAGKVRSASGACVGLTGAPQYLQENYHGGKILISSRIEWVLHNSGLPVKEFIHEGNRPLWEEALDDPTPYARWIVMVAGAQPGLEDDMVFLGLHDSPAVAANYTKVFDARAWPSTDGMTKFRLRPALAEGLLDQTNPASGPASRRGWHRPDHSGHDGK